MIEPDEIRKALAAFMDRQVGLLACFTGTVKEVDEDQLTCTVSPGNGDPDFHEVRFAPGSTSGAGFLAVPKVGSEVLCGKLSKDIAVVLLPSNVTKYIIKGDVEIQLNGDEHGGLPISSKVAERLKRLENAFDSIKQVFNSHIHPSTSGTTSQTVTPVVVELEPKTDADYLLNEKVKHG